MSLPVIGCVIMSRTFHEHTLYCLHPDSACTGFQVMPDGHKYGKLQADLL